MTTFNQDSMVVITTRFKASEKNHEGNVKKAFGEVVKIANDVKLIAAGGKAVETNRFVLSVFSPSLEELLSENAGESTVVHLPDCSFTSLQHLLRLFREGISWMSFTDFSDLNELIDTAKLLNVDIRNFSFINKNSPESEDIGKNEGKVPEILLDKNYDGKRMGRLSFETNPSSIKKSKIDGRSPLDLNSFKENEKLNPNLKKHPSEDSGFKSLPDIDSVNSDNSHLPLPVKHLKNPINLLPTFPQSPNDRLREKISSYCNRKDGKDSSFCYVHKKNHSGKKGDSNEVKSSAKVRRKLLSTKDLSKDWKCDVCEISFNIREKLRYHRREVKCKQRIVCKNKQRSINLPIQEDQSILPFPEDLLSFPEKPIIWYTLEQNSYGHLSNISSQNDSISFQIHGNIELVQDAREESLPYIDKSSKFSSLMLSSLVSTNEESNRENLNKENNSKDEINKMPSSKPLMPRRLALSQLVSSQIPSTVKEVMSPFEAKFNTSPIRKQLLMKCCPQNSTLRRCCLKLDKSPQLKSRKWKPSSTKK